MNVSATLPSAIELAPPKAPLTFRAGVVGHRPHRLKKADLKGLNQVLHEILHAIKESVLHVATESQNLYAAMPPVLRAVSPLAEGSDRIFATQALDLGFQLCCVMPFTQAEFERDFEPPTAFSENASVEFRSLLARAESETGLTRFELEGVRQHAGQAYAAAGRVVLNQSDLLIVIWDGEDDQNTGGTSQTFREARLLGVPVVWIDAHAPHQWQIITPDRSFVGNPDTRNTPSPTNDVSVIQSLVSGLLSPPSAHRSEAREQINAFLQERQPRFQFAVMWTLVQSLIGKRQWPKLSFRIIPFEAAVENQWPRDRSSAIAATVDELRPFYAWPDKLSAFYADRYRSAFLVAYLLAGLAVLFALLPLGANLRSHGLAETLCIAGELLAIVTILLLVYFGRRGKWHARWIDYRISAELIRQMRIVSVLGAERSLPQPAAQLGEYGEPSETWMAWYARTVERHLGLPSTVVDREYVLFCLNHLRKVVTGQATYHEGNSTCSERIEHALHLTGLCLLAMTLLACGLHLLPSVWHEIHLPRWLPPNVLTFACGVFPALGAALAGINNQAEFRRISKRSEAMAEKMRRLESRIEAFIRQIQAGDRKSEQQLSINAANLASETARLLVNEVLDWRVVFLDRPLVPPA